MSNWKFTISVEQQPDQLRRVGPLIPGGWLHPNETDPEHRVNGYFLVDTGAAGIGIDEDVANSLAIVPTETKRIHGINGEAYLNMYTAKLFLPVRDTSGQSVAFGVPVECMGNPALKREHERYGLTDAKGGPVQVIGILGRLFTQFALITVVLMALRGALALLLTRRFCALAESTSNTSVKRVPSSNVGLSVERVVMELVRTAKGCLTTIGSRCSVRPTKLPAGR